MANPESDRFDTLLKAMLTRPPLSSGRTPAAGTPVIEARTSGEDRAEGLGSTQAPKGRSGAIPAKALS